MDLTDPAFPHGKDQGYLNGCRKSPAVPCPASPTCNDAHNERMREYRRRTSKKVRNAKHGRHTTYVLRRLATTLEHATVEQVSERTGIPATRVTKIANGHDGATYGTVIAESTAGPLDAAWAWFIYGADVTAPDFPHGTSKGYDKGKCRCTPCADAMQRVRKRSQQGFLSPNTKVATTAKVRRHAAALIDAVGSANRVQTLTGIKAAIMREIAAGERPQVRYGIALRILAVDPAELARKHGPKAWLPADRALHIVGTLNALGYPTWWINKHAKVAPQRRWAARPNLSPTTMRRLEDLAARIGSRAATVADGITEESIGRTKARAAREGFFPPLCYDATGELIYAAIPPELRQYVPKPEQPERVSRLETTEERWVRVTAKAETRVKVLYLRARGGLKVPEIAYATGYDERRITRLCTDMGLNCVQGSIELTEEAQPIAERVIEVYKEVMLGRMTPVAAHLTLGIPRQIVREHPDAVAFRAQQTDSEAA